MSKSFRSFALRLAMIAYFLLYPAIFALALPWAYLEGRTQWGHTAFDTWLEGWNCYFTVQTARDFLRLFYKPMSYFS